MSNTQPNISVDRDLLPYNLSLFSLPLKRANSASNWLLFKPTSAYLDPSPPSPKFATFLCHATCDTIPGENWPALTALVYSPSTVPVLIPVGD